MLLYITKIIVPYLQEKKKSIGLPPDCSSLVIFDEFKGQTTDNVLAYLKENNVFYVKVPANCTDRLQPLDVSGRFRCDGRTIQTKKLTVASLRKG